MAQTTSARRYAEATFEIAERDGTLDAWLRDLDAAATMLTDQDATRLLDNPAVPVTARLEVAQRVLGDRVSEKCHNLVALLVRRGRADLLGPVAHEFRQLYNGKEGIVTAEVTSASPLDHREQVALRERLAQYATGTIEMNVHVDPTILGGVVVRLGDQLIDGSVRGRLERLRARLEAGAL